MRNHLAIVQKLAEENGWLYHPPGDDGKALFTKGFVRLDVEFDTNNQFRKAHMFHTENKTYTAQQVIDILRGK